MQHSNSFLKLRNYCALLKDKKLMIQRKTLNPKRILFHQPLLKLSTTILLMPKKVINPIWLNSKRTRYHQNLTKNEIKSNSLLILVLFCFFKIIITIITSILSFSYTVQYKYELMEKVIFITSI